MTRPTAVVTGAGRGIGLATCSRFIEEGFHVLMADIDPAVKETAATLGNGQTTPIVADISTEEGREAVVNAVEEREAPWPRWSTTPGSSVTFGW